MHEGVNCGIHGGMDLDDNGPPLAADGLEDALGRDALERAARLLARAALLSDRPTADRYNRAARACLQLLSDRLTAERYSRAARACLQLLDVLKP